jgi:hypothetical protein
MRRSLRISKSISPRRDAGGRDTPNAPRSFPNLSAMLPNGCQKAARHLAFARGIERAACGRVQVGRSSARD